MLSRLSWLVTKICRPSLLAPIAVVLVAVSAFYVLNMSDTASVSFMPLAGANQPKQRPPAPEFPANHDWLNTEKPITMADLKGRIVLLDFWTLCCINCIHTLPDLAKIEARYPGMVVVIGVHTPKFDNEKKTSSIFKAILRYEIKHPVINDIDHKMWKAYGVNSWPTLVLIDPDGKVYGFAPGEGNFDLVDQHINKLLKEFKGKIKNDPFEVKLIKEKFSNPIYFPGKVLADAASDRIFIADSTNHRIVITNLAGKKIAIAGSGKEGLKDGKFADAQFSDPQGMALAGDILYVADRKNHAIRALHLKDEMVKLVAGNGEQNRFNRQGNESAALKTALNSPWDLLMFKNKIYVAMAGHHQIWTFDPGKEPFTDPSRGRVAAYAGSGAEEIKDGALQGTNINFTSAFAQPSGLATDGKKLFVADSETSSVRAVPMAGIKGTVSTIVGEGLFEFGDKNGKGKEVRLQHALGIAYFEDKLYVADTYNSKIKIIDPKTRSCDTFLGDPPGWLKEKMFNEPGGVSISGGKLYIADTNNHRIQIVDIKSRQISTLKLQDVEPLRRGEEMSSTKESKEKK